MLQRRDVEVAESAPRLYRWNTELRRRLPQYIARAEAGEEIMVSRRGEVVARHLGGIPIDARPRLT